MECKIEVRATKIVSLHIHAHNEIWTHTTNMHIFDIPKSYPISEVDSALSCHGED